MYQVPLFRVVVWELRGVWGGIEGRVEEGGGEGNRCVNHTPLFVPLCGKGCLTKSHRLPNPHGWDSS